MSRMRKKKYGFGAAKIICLLLLAVIVLVPIIFLLSIAFKTESEFIKEPLGLPAHFSLDNFIRVYKLAEIPHVMLNSVIITVFSVFLQIIIGALAAYGLTKMKFKKSNLYINLFLIPMIFSIQAVVIPVFLMFKQLSLLNSYIGAILIYTATGLALTIFILSKFFKGISDSVSEAAIVDGASHLTIFVRIILPLAKTPIATIIVINGLAVWNDFFVPLIFFTNGKIKTMPLSIYSFTQNHSSSWTLIFTDIIFIITPIIIVYIFLQKYIIKGVAAGAVKG